MTKCVSDVECNIGKSRLSVKAGMGTWRTEWGMRGMMGIRGIRVGMRGIVVGMRGIVVGMWEI